MNDADVYNDTDMYASAAARVLSANSTCASDPAALATFATSSAAFSGINIFISLFSPSHSSGACKTRITAHEQ